MAPGFEGDYRRACVDRKGWHTRAAIACPMLARWPGKIAPVPAFSDQMTMAIDLAADDRANFGRTNAGRTA